MGGMVCVQRHVAKVVTHCSSYRHTLAEHENAVSSCRRDVAVESTLRRFPFRGYSVFPCSSCPLLCCAVMWSDVLGGNRIQT